MRIFLVSALLLAALAFAMPSPSYCQQARDKTDGDKPGERSEPAQSVACELDKDQKDLATWPNCQSSGNSDPWICQNHDKIRKMRPRVLVLNFANNVDMDGIKDRTDRIIKALAEATRYHGYKNPKAPAFLEYQVLAYVDMRDRPVPAERKDRNSAFCPYVLKGSGGECDYSAFYSDAFARFYGFQNPKDFRRYLDLHELINRGIVHELWFYQIHDERGAPFETIECKQYYDEKCRPIPGRHGGAGNGHSDTMPWSGRSFRITFFNPHRGIGCGMENFGHALEGMANYNSIAYYRKYFNEYAEFDLDKRFGLPFNSLYAIGGEGDKVEHASGTMTITRQGKKHKVELYCATGGNVHFPPGARAHYDLESPFTVKSTIENYRLRNGQGGKDKAEDFNKGEFAQWLDFCPDGMGPWLVFWRQNMPGLDNKCVDDDGKPMKNWWPFLFY
ncbi:MAG: hypothetical protein RDV41_14125 [Planctomycetota bacterium]|nr:hypothetical protein [Planctomycetota bacterium]